MGELIEKTEITEMNIDEMSRLAEDVMQQLYVNYIDYDNQESIGRFFLLNLFLREDDIDKIRYYTVEDVKSWIEPLIPKALQMFRKGTNENGDTNFIAAKTVPDDYLIAAFAREVRNMMMIFAVQKIQVERQREKMEKENVRYLLLLEAKASYCYNPVQWRGKDAFCHDQDEWRGIYLDKNELKNACVKLAAELEEKKKTDERYQSLRVGVYKFYPEDDCMRIRQHIAPLGGGKWEGLKEKELWMKRVDCDEEELRDKDYFCHIYDAKRGCERYLLPKNFRKISDADCDGNGAIDFLERVRNRPKEDPVYIKIKRKETRQQIRRLEVYFTAADHYEEILRFISEMEDTVEFQRIMKEKFGFSFAESRMIRYLSINDFSKKEQERRREQLERLREDLEEYLVEDAP